MKPEPKRYGHTRKKLVSLTVDGRERIQAYADTHKLSFSASIEALALIGLETDFAAAVTPLLRETVQKALQRQFNRMAKLGLLAAAEAAMAHELVTILLLQHLRQEAVRFPQDFESRMAVSRDPAQTLDFRIREIYDRMRRLAKTRQQRILATPLRELLASYAPAAAQDGEPAAAAGEEALDG